MIEDKTIKPDGLNASGLVYLHVAKLRRIVLKTMCWTSGLLFHISHSVNSDARCANFAFTLRNTFQ